MDNSSPFYALIDLVNFDTRIRLYYQSIETEEKEILALQEKIHTIRIHQKNITHERMNARKYVDEQELILREIDEGLSKKKRQLDSISEYKEFRSLKAEVENLGSQLHTQENEVERAWKLLETAEKKEKEETVLLVEKIEALEKEIEFKTKVLTQLKTELATFAVGREEKKKAVPEEWLVKYDNMQSRVDDPVVPIEENSCTVCFCHLVGNDLLQAKRGGLVQCKMCYRLLFLPAAIEKKLI
jgi:predicted  nucleic acid-binding Zn-ribbon protein